MNTELSKLHRLLIEATGKDQSLDRLVAGINELADAGVDAHSGAALASITEVAGRLSREDLAVCFVEAILATSTPIGSAILRASGPLSEFELLFFESGDLSLYNSDVWVEPVGSWTASDIEQFTINHEDGALAHIFSLAIQSGIANFVRPVTDRSFLASMIYEAESSMLDSAEGFTLHYDEDLLPEIPTLMNGVVENPEVLLALNGAGLGGLEYAYSDMLCWASMGDVEGSNGALLPINPSSHIEYMDNSGASRVQRTIKLSDLSDEFFERFDSTFYMGTAVPRPVIPEKPLTINMVRFGVDAMLGDGPSRERAALNSYAPAHIQHGLGFKDGFVLCATSRDYLNTLDIEAFDQSKVDGALSYFKSRLPIGNILGFLSPVSVRPNGQFKVNSCLITRHNRLFDSILKDSERDRYIKVLPKCFWDFAFKDLAWSNSPEIHAAYRVHLGGLPEPTKADFNPDGIRRLQEYGFVFESGSELYPDVFSTPGLGQDVARNYARSVLEISRGEVFFSGLSSKASPEDLMSCPELETPMRGAVLELISRIDVGSMIALAKADSDWLNLVEAYGADVMTKHLPKLPTIAHVKMVESDFNL